MTRKPAVLEQINVVVPDVEAAVDFYRRLGIEIPDTLPEWQAHHRTADPKQGVDLDFDSCEFARQWNTGWPRSRAGVVVGFRMATREDVDDLYEELVGAGYVGQQEPYDAFWGARYAIVEDPSGNAVGLMSPSDPARRNRPTPPPA
jgi:uncharacterized glyoxalase superfamily protein PhnB